jgi:hypothetical protein
MKVIRESKYTYLSTNYRHNKKLGMILSLVSIPPIVLGVYFTNWVALFLGLLLVSIGTGYLASSRNYRVGIEGEKAVVEALQVLDDSYSMINDVVLGKKSGNIDHILICLKGVFVIETKNYSGEIRCYGDKWGKVLGGRFYNRGSVSNQARNNARHLSNLIREITNLGIFVKPICVFTDPRVKLQLHNPTVEVLRLGELAKFIVEASPVTTLTDSEIRTVAKCILDAHYKYSGERQDTKESQRGA